LIIIDYLSDLLAEKLQISVPAIRGLIKLSIKDQCGPFKDISQTSYDDIKNSIQIALKNRLLKLNIDNAQELIDLLLSELKKNQSLITMDRF